MQDVLMDLINNFGYLGIALLICIENVFPPIPSEIVLIFGGFLTINSDMNVWLVILFSTIGSVIGAAILYSLGRVMKKDRLIKLCESKVGKRLHIKPSYIQKADKWFSKYEYKAVFFGRCIPVVRSLISIPAGVSQMKIVPFFTLTILGTSVWNTILVWIGVFAGDAWEKSIEYVGWYTNIVLVVLIASAGIVLYNFFKRRKKRKQEANKKLENL